MRGYGPWWGESRMEPYILMVKEKGISRTISDIAIETPWDFGGWGKPPSKWNIHNLSLPRDSSKCMFCLPLQGLPTTGLALHTDAFAQRVEAFCWWGRVQTLLSAHAGLFIFKSLPAFCCRRGARQLVPFSPNVWLIFSRLYLQGKKG